MNVVRHTILLAPLTIFAIACGQKHEFGKTLKATSLNQMKVSRFYTYETQSDLFQQNTYDENKIALPFRAFNADGHPIDDFTKSDLTITENQNLVTDFTLSKQDGQPARTDIVFVLDETGSMINELNAVKRNVRNFVQQLHTVNIIGNLCLVTFRDDVRQRCLKFDEDDPNTPKKNENVDAFLNRMNQVTVHIGQGGDLPENQLAALISAAEETPWHQNAQRMVILLTDAQFHDLNNPGDAGSHARSYSDTISAIQDHQVSVFVVGPDIPGYSQPYEGLPSLVDASQGLFFDIKEATIHPSRQSTTSETRGLEDILDQIVESISTLYTLEYVVEENNLDPTLTIHERLHSITTPLDSSDGEVIFYPVISSMPLGRPEYKKSWNLNQDPSTKFKHVIVHVDNVIVDEGYEIKDGFLLFDDYPEPGSLIRIEYQTDTLRDHMTITPIVSELPPYDNFNVVVYYNEKIPHPNDYEVNVVDNQVFFEPTGQTFSADDPYEIRKHNGLEVIFQITEKEFTVRE